MVTCDQRKMIPMAHASRIAMSHPPGSKPKIGFSIDSIVGNASLQGHVFDSSLSPRSESSERPSSPLSDCSFPLELRASNDSNRNFRGPNECLQLNNLQRNFPIKLSANHFHNSGRLSPPRQNCSPLLTHQPRVSPIDDPGGRNAQRSPSPQQNHMSQSSGKGPIVVPGIPAGLIRPFPMQPQGMTDMKSMPYLNSSDLAGPPNPHILAAQFQMAAALANGHAAQGFPQNAGLPSMPHHPQFPGGGPNMIRDSYPLYPWLLSRHGRIFPHRFPGNFLLQPFRKPKRVRTAFSPSQLLKLEHAFESNHYVVGAERKTLAQTLSLTETQVKVWFQNRRTKHKRMQQEENSKGGNSNNGSDCKNSSEDNNGNSQTSFEEDNEEDELIDMDDCPSDHEEGDLGP